MLLFGVLQYQYWYINNLTEVRFLLFESRRALCEVAVQHSATQPFLPVEENAVPGQSSHVSRWTLVSTEPSCEPGQRTYR